MLNLASATDSGTRSPSMLRWIIGSSLKFRFLVVLAAAVLVAFGILQLRNIPSTPFPSSRRHWWKSKPKGKACLPPKWRS